MRTIQSWDDRRDLWIAPTEEEAILFAAQHWILTGQRSIQRRGRFAVALAGGSTPKSIYGTLASHHRNALPWNQVHLFWGDERCVPPDHPESNYRMAMESGLSELPIPPHQIHRMHGEISPEVASREYDLLIRKLLLPGLFDLVMLGVGDDGHTASLFPHTPILEEVNAYVGATLKPVALQQRLTLTFPAIHGSHHVMVCALGKAKEAIVPLVLNAAVHSSFPASALGAHDKKALWILDAAAARLLPLSDTKPKK